MYPITLTERFAHELKRLEATYLPIRTAGNWRKTFLLQYHHVCLNLLGDFLQEFSENYVWARKRDYDTQHSKLLRWQLKKMAADSELYGELSDTGRSITEIIESLLEALASTTTDKQDHSSHLTALGIDLRRSCRDVQARLAKLSGDLERRLKFLELRRNIDQTDNVERLTLLATVFLPMSLAAGILSMQTRFTELGDLLYDFVGVVVLLGSGAIALFAVLITLGLVKELDSRLMWFGFYRRFIRRVLTFGWVATLASLAALVLASFVVGMFKDVALGAKILGYGALAIVFGPLTVGVVGFAALYVVLRCHQAVKHWTRARVRRRRRDSEGDQGSASSSSGSGWQI
ncbi:hypothetical protein NKR19_g5241 [Coniochaeta hoffmannii]|uniref:Uncharacterized protein n=1 Tax=Coniochaeta hoffmannii TaxID=91930 RepID=A0AA38RIU1_9PEZI|nr:hypothetical protein NKR19_g5241 [Coniochaeta hoffmannii]